MTIWIASHSDGRDCERATTTHDCPLQHSYRRAGYIATQAGMTLKPGDTVIDFRGDAHIFHGVARPAEPGREAKISTTTAKGFRNDFYAGVFPGLEVIHLD